jgi:hypothetical protein
MKIIIVLSALLLSSSLFVSCNKEQRWSNKLQGTWDLVSVNGEDTTAAFRRRMKFVSDKDGKGTGTNVIAIDTVSDTLKFDYQIEGDNFSVFYVDTSYKYEIIQLKDLIFQLRLDGTDNFKYNRSNRLDL